MPLTNKKGGISRVIISNQAMYNFDGVAPFLGIGKVLQQNETNENNFTNFVKLRNQNCERKRIYSFKAKNKFWNEVHTFQAFFFKNIHFYSAAKDNFEICEDRPLLSRNIFTHVFLRCVHSTRHFPYIFSSGANFSKFYVYA